MEKIVFTRHGQDAIRERGIEPEWVIRAVINPEWTGPDADRPGIDRRFRSIAEREGRVLRVACLKQRTKSV